MATGAFIPIAAVEQDYAAAATYATNFGNSSVYCGDIADWSTGDSLDPDVVAARVPAIFADQSVDPRAASTGQFIDTVARLEPKSFLLISSDRYVKSRTFVAFVEEQAPTGRLADYRVRHAILNAANYGTAQIRRYAVVLGTRRDLDEIVLPTPTTLAPQWSTVYDAIGDVEPEISETNINLPTDRVRIAFDTRVPGPYATDELHITSTYSGLTKKRIRYIPPGGNHTDVPDHLKIHCWSQKPARTGLIGRLSWDRPAGPINTEFFKPEKGRYLHPDQHRAISAHEAARLQGFPDTHQWCGSKVEIARQIGTAVPVPLVQHLAQYLAMRL